MPQNIGVLLRRQRLEKNWSQEGLCKGICAVSYLSKIEQGQVQPSKEMADALLCRLGLTLWTEEELCRRAQRELDEMYEKIFCYGDLELRSNSEPYFTPWIEQHKAQLFESPYLLDMLVLQAVCDSQHGLDTFNLEEYRSHFTGRQRVLYLMCRDREEEALEYMPCGVTFFVVGTKQTRLGNYAAAIGLLEKGFSCSSQECNPVLMAKCKAFLGNCHSELEQWEQMEKSYQDAQRLFRVLNDPSKEDCCDSILYNMGATWIQRGEPEKGIELLNQCRHIEASHCHKMAVAHELLGNTEQALEWVAKGYTFTERSERLNRMRLELVEYRLRHPDFLQQQEYAEKLKGCIDALRNEAPVGWLRFELPWYLSYLEYSRQYKQLAEILRGFSGINRFY